MVPYFFPPTAAKAALGAYNALVVLLVFCSTLFLHWGFHQPYNSAKWLALLLLGCLLASRHGLFLPRLAESAPGMLLFACWSTLPILRLPWTAHWGWAAQFLAIYLPLLLLGLCLPPPAMRRRLRSLLYASSILASLYGLLQVLGFDFWALDPAGVPFSTAGNSHQAALLSLTALLLGRRPVKLAWLDAILLLHLALCQSKTVWLATLCACLLLPLPVWKKFLASGLFLLAMLWSIHAGHWVALSQGLASHQRSWLAQPIDDAARDPSFRGKALGLSARLVLLRQSLRTACAGPFWGVGGGQFPAIYARFSRQDPLMTSQYRVESPHNFLLHLGIEQGWPWLIALLALLLPCWFKARRFQRAILLATLPLLLFHDSHLQPQFLPFLLLLLPHRLGRALPRAPVLLLALALLGCAILALDWRSCPAHPLIRQTFFPARLADCQYPGNPVFAAQLAWRGARQDPYSPESLFLLASLGHELAPSEQGRALCQELMEECLRRFPLYQPALQWLHGRPQLGSAALSDQQVRDKIQAIAAYLLAPAEGHAAR
jgi:hypothetical protein